ncbi:hypothetical protein OG848_22135 [Streptomyces canus]|uniref:hypothetical protein n=1 Tax=Streptomyces canus TaxID=58343 RepID=UPI00324A8B52
MVPRRGVAIYMTPRELPFWIVSASGGGLGASVGAPLPAVLLAAFLVAMHVNVQRCQGPNS